MRLFTPLAGLALLLACADTTDPDPDPQEPEQSTACAVTAESDELRVAMLQLINEARASARMCGEAMAAAVPPVTWACRLEDAAQAHALDMASHDFFEHVGSDGSTASTRVARTGYPWQSVGENLAGGQSTPEAAVEGWLESPSHCANIMNGQWEHMGVSFADGANTEFGRYWVQVFALRREEL